MKGFDRYIYQLSTRGLFVNDVLTETIENIEAFKEVNNFMWICIPDLHDIADRYEEPLGAQVKTNILNRQIDRNDSPSSVRQKYSRNLIDRYKSQLKRIDTYLGLLFNYIIDNFNNDEIIVSLMADHGQGFLIKSNEFLDEERSNIAMMFRGKGIPNGTCAEPISLLDFFPIILNSIGITDYEKKESNIPKYFGGESSREYTYTESLHANFEYHAVINDLKYKFFFKTNKVNTDDGRIHISSKKDFSYSLINKRNSINEADEKTELVEYYINIVLSHIKEYIII
jgi:membrane-anchored protein YejM (alkaline phosphatase superfamily)